MGKGRPGITLHLHGNNTRLFPKSIGEILVKYHVEELHLSLTQGLWKSKKWGYPVISAPPGAQLWVWFKDSVKDVNTVWKDLTNALSGQFCASLNFIDETNTIIPNWTFRPEGIRQNGFNRSLIRYASLPRENVCTENLTPWKKLLPCGSEQGLSTLLDAVDLFNSHYNSLNVKIRSVCTTENCQKSSLELSQSVSVVSQPPQLKQKKRNWSLFRLFGTTLFSSCSLAENSRILVDVTSNKTGDRFYLHPAPSEFVNIPSRHQNLAVYNVKDFIENDKKINIEGRYPEDISHSRIPSPVLYAHRFIAGIGQERGEIRCEIYNKNRKNVTIMYQEVVPWFIRIYLSKLKIISHPRENRLNRYHTIKPVSKYYKPGKDRQSPAHLELIFQLPPQSITEVSLEFERGFLKWTEHPPDANHGFYISAAVISAIISPSANYTSISVTSSLLYNGFKDDSLSSYFLRIYTETLLISLPTPDFSMPYNVICLACTVVALAFGPLHNITTKSLVAIDPDEKTGLIHKIKSFIFKKKSDHEEKKNN
ncbi:GPI transamidase component PIG-T [Nymphon striatum]|nr:GPI transamidase component PIG-T [Nymphon striatum]